MKIGACQETWIAENRTGAFKRYTVFSKICGSLRLVPFELNLSLRQLSEVSGRLPVHFAAPAFPALIKFAKIL